VSDAELPRFASILHALRDGAERHADQRALVCRGRELSYAELGRAVLALSERLRGRGACGQRVIVALPTSMEGVVAVLGALAAGAQVAPVNPFFTSSELAAMLPEVDARLAIAGADAGDKLATLAPALGLDELLLFGPEGEGLTLETLLGPGALAWPPMPEPDALALAIFTGGTTGLPKAVEHSHAALMVGVLQHCSVWPLRRGGERFLSAAPIFHVWGLSYATFVPLYAAGTLVLVPRFDPDEVLSALETEGVGVFCGGPAPVYVSLMQSARFASTDFRSLVYCLTGGAPCPRELHERWRAATGCGLLEGWGMSEAAPLCLSRPGATKPTSVGRPVPFTELQIVDLETGSRVLEDGEPGEVRVRGPQLMRGYRGRPADSAVALRDGWLHTGDIGYLDSDGDLFLVDRKKDMIIVGGYNVYPRTVDEVLYRHPAIAEAATVGRADARLGEVLVAFVVLAPGAQLDEAGFLEFCARELVKYRRPVAVTFLAALPRTSARKVDRRALRELAGAAA
jgi:long-chain acyl-CoA synthetase